MVTISGVNYRKLFRIWVSRSLRFRITLLLLCAGVIPGVILKTALIKGYESHAVQVRTAEIQNQCTILSSQLGTLDSFSENESEPAFSELTYLSGIYNGRIMLIDENFYIAYDTYDMDVGKQMVSENVNRCFQGNETDIYDADHSYIEITAPIHKPQSDEVRGVLLASISTDSIADTCAQLDRIGTLALLIIGAVVAIFAVAAGFIMVRPFKRITQTIDAVSGGYGDLELHENTYAETKMLSATLNKAVGQMKALDDSRQEFVANVSHELKTPLTSVKLLADSLLAQPDTPVELYREFMQDISEEIEREDKIINDLLSLVKMDKSVQTIRVAPVNINSLIERILKRLQPIAQERHIEVVFESFRLVEAEVDETRFSLAVMNLVENAVKYNREGGWIHVSLDADAKYFQIVVEDGGIGIPQEDQPYIFERFYRVDKSHSREIGGTGLGLSIVRNVVVMHRGAIRCKSKEGEGSTFTVRIPLNYIA